MTLPPPDPPPGIRDPLVTEYLKRLILWAHQQIDLKVSSVEASPQILLSPSDEKPPRHVFSLTVDSSGAIAVSLVPIGSGKP